MDRIEVDMNHTKETLQKVSDLLTPDMWCKNTLQDSDGKCCIIGAVMLAAGEKPHHISPGFMAKNLGVVECIDHAVKRHSPEVWERLPGKPMIGGSPVWMKLVTWNNAPATTFEDIKAVLDDALSMST